MKVNISYAVDFEKVPEEINRIFKKIKEDAKEFESGVAQLRYTHGIAMEFIQTIVALKERFESLDEDMVALANIVAGYEKILLNNQLPEQQQVQAQPEVESTEDDG